MIEPKENVTFRLSPEDRAVVQSAADLERKRIGAFIRDAVIAAARRVIAREKGKTP